MRTFFYLFALCLVFNSCQSGGDSTEAAGEESTPATEEKAASADTGNKKYTLTPFSPSQAYPDAMIMGMTYQDGRFDFDVKGEAYQLGAQTPDAGQKSCANSAKGQHIHLIVDDQPYAAKYEASFEHDVADGDHYILAFLSRSYHESIKTNAASRVRKVTVANKSIAEETTVEGTPLLFYSRPKGTYKGKANTDKVMLDFFVYNATLGDDVMVKADINGEEHIITQWQPYYIEGLPMGENTITLTLADKSGQTIETPLNPVTRTFTLAVDEAEVSN
ncbi:MAG: phosphopeptide-binding protein [Bacteroidota bacterium]